MRNTVCLLPVLALLLFAAATPRSVWADTFDATWTGAYGNGSATITASLVSGDEYIVTAMTGTQGGSAVTLLAVNGYASNDNDIYYPASPEELDFSGVAFSAGGEDYDVYFDNESGDFENPSDAVLYGGYAECSSSVNACETYPEDEAASVPITFSLTEVTPAAVPQPSSLVLLSPGSS